MSTLGALTAEPLRDSRGDSLFPLKPDRKSLRGASPLERIEAWSVPCPMSGCCLWLGGLDGDGKPKMHFNGRTCVAYRVALESRLERRLPSGILAMHTCDVPLCVNPGHLFPGTHIENMADMVRKGRASRRGSGGRRLAPHDYPTIRELRKAVGTKELAERYAVTRGTIKRIVNGTRGVVPGRQAAE